MHILYFGSKNFSLWSQRHLTLGHFALFFWGCPYESSKIPINVNRRIHQLWVILDKNKKCVLLRIHSTLTPTSNLSHFKFMIGLDLVSFTWVNCRRFNLLSFWSPLLVLRQTQYIDLSIYSKLHRNSSCPTIKLTILYFWTNILKQKKYRMC